MDYFKIVILRKRACPGGIGTLPDVPATSLRARMPGQHQYSRFQSQLEVLQRSDHRIIF